MIPLDEVVHFDAITRDPETLVVSDADSTPTFAVFEEATDTPILSAQNFTKRTSLTGHYRGTFTASAANGFEVGKYYTVIASATVNGYADKDIVGWFRVVAAEAQAGYPKGDTQYVEGTAPEAAGDVVDALYTEAGTRFLPVDPHKVAFSVSGDTLTVYEPDGSTTAYTRTVTTDPSAEPITGAS